MGITFERRELMLIKGDDPDIGIMFYDHEADRAIGWVYWGATWRKTFSDQYRVARAMREDVRILKKMLAKQPHPVRIYRGLNRADGTDRRDIHCGGGSRPAVEIIETLTT